MLARISKSPGVAVKGNNEACRLHVWNFSNKDQIYKGEKEKKIRQVDDFFIQHCFSIPLAGEFSIYMLRYFLHDGTLF